jgi:hypothetical protein
LIFLALLVALTYGPLQSRMLGDAGLGWHIRAGEQILATRSIPRVDPFSSGHGGESWYAWEWLYDVLVGALASWCGLNGVVFLHALVIGLTFAMLFRLVLKRSANLPGSLLLVLLSVCAAALHLFARPHVVSWLFTLLWWNVLDRCTEGDIGRRWLWSLPGLMLVWVNLHGGFLVGFVLLGLYMAGALARRFCRPGEEQPVASGGRLRELAAVTTVSALASLVNPYGYRLYFHIYGYLTDRFLMNHIEEFRSPDFHFAAQKCFAILLLITLAAVGMSSRKLKAAHLLVVLFAVFSGLYAARSIPVSSMLLALIVAPLLSCGAPGPAEVKSWVSRLGSNLRDRSRRLGAMELRLRGHIWPAAAVVLTLWICAHQGRLGSATVLRAHFDARKFPVEAAEVLARQDAHEAVLSLDSWGGYLIYRLYPGVKVMVDDRHDFYGSEFLRDYLKMVNAEPGWDGVLDATQARWVLLPPRTPLASVLKQSSQWRIVQDDGVAILFERASRN